MPKTALDRSARVRPTGRAYLYVPGCLWRLAPICSNAVRSQARRSAPAGRCEAPSAMMRRSNPSAPRSPVTNLAIDRAEAREFAES